jgi:hypothetical protein
MDGREKEEEGYLRRQVVLLDEEKEKPAPSKAEGAAAGRAAGAHQ